MENLNERDKYENLGTTYLKSILKNGWTVTEMPPCCHWDCTVSKGDREYTVENKVRNYTIEKCSDGLLLDNRKVGENIDYYIQYLEDTAFIITYDEILKGKEDGTIKPDNRFCNKFTVDSTTDKVKKDNILIPLNLFTKKHINRR